MRQKTLAKSIVWIRRGVQALFLALFFYLFWSLGAREEESTDTLHRFLFLDFDPLAWLWTSLAARAWTMPALLCIVTLVVTVLLGRVFCGWFCPFGTVNAMVGWLRKYMRKTRPSHDAWTRWQRAKYYALAGFLVLAAVGSAWVGVFDPLCLLYRSTATVVYPGVQYMVEDGATAVYQSDPHVGPVHLKSLTEPTYRFLRDHIFVWKRQVFNGSAVIFSFFLVIVLLNLYRNRFWCRYICPLGGLLGLCSQRPVLRLANQEGCNQCGICARRCPAAADPDQPGHWKSTECFGCWNCVAACNRNAIAFKFRSPFPAPSAAKLDLSKRAVLSAGLGGLGGLVLFRTAPQGQNRVYNPELIRPPGAHDEREFLKRCIRCGLCMKVCPTNALHPTGLEAGLEGVWSPVLVPRVGYCEYNCNLCGRVCPTGAIQYLKLDKKQQTKIGLATVDQSRCLPHAYQRECLICEEHCPIPTKAIFFVPKEVHLRDGKTLTLKQPFVDPNRCIGCGICENVCVFKDRPAIRVTSANETRHSGNAPVLPGLPGLEAPSSPPPSDANPYGQASNNPYK